MSILTHEGKEPVKIEIISKQKWKKKYMGQDS